ncbi:MAG: hypothetical protein M3545_03635 [Acidobacteriota bacterium]|nr:hypothetical protein [Acidobacteriota bacterium]
MAAGRASAAVLRSAGLFAPEARGLALLSTLSATALVWLLFALFRSLRPDDTNPGAARDAAGRNADRHALWATVTAIASPLFWFTALRPLSDMMGLAGAVAAQALIVAVLSRRAGPAALMWGGLLAGLAIGIRSQTFLLTLPLLAMALVVPRLGLRARDRAAAVAATGLGVCAWAFPLVWASGGLSEYAAALGTQAGEDFSGVVMLWNVRAARVAVDGLVASFLWPWGSLLTGTVVVAAAAVGAGRTAWCAPRVLLLLAVGFLPYAVFHLLFHEVVTVRYALPLLLPAAYLAVSALAWIAPSGPLVGCSVLAAVCLVPAVSASVAYAREGSPAFRAFRALQPGPHTASGQSSFAVDAVGMHAVARRVAQWEGSALPGRVLDAPHGREWLALVAEWRAHPDAQVAFVADPRRTDLALVDPRSRQRVASYRWPFVEPPYVGGARPGNSELYRMSPPQWMLDRGWALGAEVAGVTARDGLGPHRRPSVAWIRTGHEETLLMLGGRHLGGARDPVSRVSVRVGGRPLESFDVTPGFFFRTLAVPAGALASAEAYVTLDVKAESAATLPAMPVALEQFDLQRGGVPMIGVEEGWQEPEYDPRTGRAWRWATERATLWVRPIGRDVRLIVQGESPRRYFATAPVITLTVAGREIARFSPASDFREDIVLPAAALSDANGRVVLESDQWFSPGDRDGSPDRRHLAVRIYSYAVE